MVAAAVLMLVSSLVGQIYRGSAHRGNASSYLAQSQLRGAQAWGGDALSINEMLPKGNSVEEEELDCTGTLCKFRLVWGGQCYQCWQMPSFDDNVLLVNKTEDAILFTVDTAVVPHFTQPLVQKIQTELGPETSPGDTKAWANEEEYVPIELSKGCNVERAGFLGGTVLSVQSVDGVSDKSREAFRIKIRRDRAVLQLKNAFEEAKQELNWREMKEDEFFHIGTHYTAQSGHSFDGNQHFHYVSSRKLTNEEQQLLATWVNKYHGSCS